MVGFTRIKHGRAELSFLPLFARFYFKSRFSRYTIRLKFETYDRTTIYYHAICIDFKLNNTAFYRLDRMTGGDTGTFLMAVLFSCFIVARFKH